ncbi:HAD-IA family hydrolase [Candidatus Uhrbacteria bacterium]|nr:HAD-IA family hydrolase [Candidatus Uhrbacteria bacterium]
MNSIKAILFDVDGTLVNTDESIYAGLEYTLKKFSLPCPGRDTLKNYFSKTLARMFAELAPTGPQEEMLHMHRTFQKEHIELNKEFPGVRETLAFLREQGFVLGAISNRTSHTMHDILAHVGIDTFFATVITADQITKPKPDPESLLKCLSILECSPIDAMMVGDAWSDIEAGKLAGMATCAVLSGPQGDKVLEAGPNHVLKTAAELPSLFVYST